MEDKEIVIKNLLDEESSIENSDDDFSYNIEKCLALDPDEFELLKEIVENKCKELNKTKNILNSLTNKIKEIEEDKKSNLTIHNFENCGSSKFCKEESNKEELNKEKDKPTKLHFDEDWGNEDDSTKAIKENESVWDFEEEIKPVIEEPKDIYKEVKECLSKEPIFDINENDEKLVETIFDENLPYIKLEIDLAKNNKLTTTWGDIYLRHRRIIITTPNIYNLMTKNTVLQSMSTSALFNENGTMNYSLGQVDDPINDLKYLVFFSQEVDKDEIIIINDNKVRWGYIRGKEQQNGK